MQCPEVLVRAGAEVSNVAEYITVARNQVCLVGLHESPGVLHEGVQDWLKLERCLTNRLQHFRRGCLSLERFLRLVEETDILDGDDRLIGERLHQADLTVGERSGLALPDEDRADRPALAV